MMNMKMSLSLVAAAFALTACVDAGPNKSVDRGYNSHPVSELQAGIWVDPNGCDHWIIDDGVEGYLSARLDKYGKPVCSGIGEPNTAVGDFKNPVPDPI
ncbi:MAG: hypothetical protein KUG74_16750 [Rhodobacteraceae bacterium]|nr:hypothetical protein [Paracoccaceae bacterium]